MKWDVWWVYICQGSRRNPEVPPLWQGVSQWIMRHLNDEMTLQEILPPAKRLELPISSLAGELMIPEFTWLRTETVPASERLPLSLSPLTPSCSLQGCAHPLHPGRYFAHHWLTPSLPEPPALHSLFQYHLWIHSSPQTWGNWRTTTFILSQVLSTVQILVSRHIQRGVGFGGFRWTAASLQFTTVGTSPQMILMMFKPLTLSISHSQPI